MPEEPTPVFKALNKADLVCGVSNKFFACELMLCGLIVFVLKIHYLTAAVLLIHAIAAFLNCKEPLWREIAITYITMNEETNAKLP